MKKPSGKSSIFSSGAVVAATISGVAAVLTAALPSVLGTRENSQAMHDAPNETMVAPGNALAVAPVAPIPPVGTVPQLAVQAAMPNLTYGAWSIVNSIDEVGTDFSGSILKFVSQREFVGGLEATGFFEWRKGDQVLGREHVVANYDVATRQIFIEGKYVENLNGQLAVGSYSARVSGDGRQLVAGRWGNTPNNQAGIAGKWEARR